MATAARKRTMPCNRLTSIDVPPPITLLTARKNAPFGLSTFVSSTPASAGVSVSALNAEIAIETAIVSANC